MLTEKIYCECGRVIRIKQHNDGPAMFADRDARMLLPVEHCDVCEAKERAQRIMDFNRQAQEIASEHNNDAAIDHSQPHDPSDMERELETLEDEEFLEPKEVYFEDNAGYIPCNCEDYPCCGH